MPVIMDMKTLHRGFLTLVQKQTYLAHIIIQICQYQQYLVDASAVDKEVHAVCNDLILIDVPHHNVGLRDHIT